jgi:3-oxoadipate enol-lactonase
MGGMVGQELALRHPALVRALVLANTTSAYPEAAREVWQQRIATVRAQGIEVIADAVMGRYFHEGFRAAQAATVARYRHRLVTTDAVGYVGCCHAVGTVDTSARLGAIRVPCLVIAGELDQGTPVAMAQTLVDGLADARLEIIAEASHVSAVEQPVVFAELVSGFIGEL